MRYLGRILGLVLLFGACTTSSPSNSDSLVWERVFIPEYPELAKRTRRQGTLIVGFRISSKGIPEQVQIMSGSYALFDQSVLEAAKEWRFKPGQPSQSGEDLKTVEVAFELVDDSSDEAVPVGAEFLPPDRMMVRAKVQLIRRVH